MTDEIRATELIEMARRRRHADGEYALRQDVDALTDLVMVLDQRRTKELLAVGTRIALALEKIAERLIRG